MLRVGKAGEELGAVGEVLLGQRGEKRETEREEERASFGSWFFPTDWGDCARDERETIFPFVPFFPFFFYFCTAKQEQHTQQGER